MIYKISNDIKTDFDGYQQLLLIQHKCLETSDNEIILDFSNVSFFEANLCAVLATIIEIIEDKGKSVKLINFNNYVENILRKNNFLIPYGYSPIFDNYQTSISYKRFDPKNILDDNNFESYIREELLNKKDFPSHSKLLGKHITLRIFELYENARTHGLCRFIHTCGQYFPRKPQKPLNVTIVDTGKNIHENISEFLQKDISAIDAIEWAMINGNTTKKGNISGGLGLDLIFQFIQHNNGKFQLISGNGFWEWHNGNTNTKILDHSFKGTIANIRFNLNDNSHYFLTEEITNLENPF